MSEGSHSDEKPLVIIKDWADKLGESVSALMDNAETADDIERLLQAMSSPAGRIEIKRRVVAFASLQQGDDGQPSTDVSRAVMRQIRSEAIIENPLPQLPSWRQALAQMKERMAHVSGWVPLTAGMIGGWAFVALAVLSYGIADFIPVAQQNEELEQQLQQAIVESRVSVAVTVPKISSDGQAGLAGMEAAPEPLAIAPEVPVSHEESVATDKSTGHRAR